MATMTSPRSGVARRPLNTLSRLTLAALLGVVLLLLLGFMALALRAFEPIIVGVAAVPLVVAGVIALRWRWAPLLGTLVLGLLTLLLLASVRELVLTHPSGALFTLLLLLAPVTLVSLAASVGAAVQNYRSAEPGMPPWLRTVLLLVAGLSVGAAVVSAIPPAGAAVDVSAETLADLPAVSLPSFNGGLIRVRAGEAVALRLENSDPVAHGFAIDELGVNAVMPANSDSLALFTPTEPGSYTFYCPPHYDKASGSGMHGTIIVEP
jgi:heme/copper-type cytochrome/quinol oxidase subunit 2